MAGNEAQELHCHNCGQYVQFQLDLSIDDNYVLDCPNCGHKHYRVVQDGQITDTRWGQDPSQLPAGTTVTYVTASGTTTASTYDTYMVASSTSASTTDVSGFMWDLWARAS